MISIKDVSEKRRTLTKLGFLPNPIFGKARRQIGDDLDNWKSLNRREEHFRSGSSYDTTKANEIRAEKDVVKNRMATKMKKVKVMRSTFRKFAPWSAAIELPMAWGAVNKTLKASKLGAIRI